MRNVPFYFHGDFKMIDTTHAKSLVWNRSTVLLLFFLIV